MQGSLNGFWQTFCTTTGIRGFSFLYNSNSRVEQAIWLVAILAGTVLTINDVVETISSFSSGPTMTKMRMINELPFNIGNLSLCLLYKSGDFKNFGLNVSNPFEIAAFLKQLEGEDINSFLHHQIHKLQTAIDISDVFDEDYDKMQLVDGRFPPLVYLSSVLIATLMREELYPSNNSTFDISWGYSNSDPGLVESMKLVANFYSFGNVSVPGLMRKVPAAVWCLLEIQVGHGHPTEMVYRHNCDEKLISWHSYTPYGFNMKMCVRMSADVSLFTKSDFFQEGLIKIKTDNVLEGHYSTDLNLYVGSDVTINPDVENVVPMTLGEWRWVYVKVLGLYKSLNSAASPCAYQSSLINSFFTSIADSITAKCGCQPLFSAYLPELTHGRSQWCYGSNQTPYLSQVWCGYDKVSVIRQLRINTQLPCSRKVFSFESAPYLKTASVPNGTSALVVAVSSYIYPQFEEIPSTTARQLLAQLGGNLSLWLGASFVVLLHVFVFLVKNIIPSYPKVESNKRIDTHSVNHFRKTQQSSDMAESTGKLKEMLQQPEVVSLMKKLIKSDETNHSNSS